MHILYRKKPKGSKVIRGVGCSLKIELLSHNILFYGEICIV